MIHLVLAEVVKFIKNVVKKPNKTLEGTRLTARPFVSTWFRKIYLFIGAFWVKKPGPSAPRCALKQERIIYNDLISRLEFLNGQSLLIVFF